MTKIYKYEIKLSDIVKKCNFHGNTLLLFFKMHYAQYTHSYSCFMRISKYFIIQYIL